MIPPAVLERLAHLPLDFRSGELSPVALVAQSGFDPSRHVLSISIAREYLRQHPDLIDVWLGWSEDKRSSPAWGFQVHGSGASIFYNGQPPVQQSFPTALDACAAFIVEEIRSLVQYLPPAT